MNCRKSMLCPVLLALTLASAGCQRADEPSSGPSGAASASAAAGSEAAGPEAKPGIALTDARLTLPAVRGRPGAVYFTLRNSGDKPVSLVAAFVEGAEKAEMHEASGGGMARLRAVEVPAGATVAFEPGGRHVMAFALADSLAAGGTTELTLSFADGDKVSAPVAVRPAGSGGAMKGMEGGEHMKMHGDMDMATH